MKLSRSIKWTCCAMGAIALGAMTAPDLSIAQGRGGGAPAAPLTSAEKPRMQPEEAPGAAAVFGNPNAEGFYVTRNRFGPHSTSKPHFHDKDRWVTVIKGTWYGGEGDVYKTDTASMIGIKAGGFMYHPAGNHHYDGSCNDEEVIVQIMGYGPVRTIQTEVDEKGAPVFNNPANPNRGSGPADTRGCQGTPAPNPARGAAPAAR